MTSTSPVRMDHLAVARHYAARQDDWPFAPRFNPFQRWYRRLAQESDVEVWLLTWLPGQRTGLHDHGGCAGAFVAVSGKLTERTFGTAGLRLVETSLPQGNGLWFGPHHIHEITNDGERPAVSVHVYGPALTTMTRYQFDEEGLGIAALDQAAGTAPYDVGHHAGPVTPRGG
jgi:hypothetical protein